jgi:hypothetical protein
MRAWPGCAGPGGNASFRSFAAVLGASGEADAALETVIVWMALRVLGEVKLATGSDKAVEAESNLREAKHVAEKQGAKAFELRAAASLALANSIAVNVSLCAAHDLCQCSNLPFLASAAAIEALVAALASLARADRRCGCKLCTLRRTHRAL